MKRIFLVDSDQMMRDLIRRALTEQEFDVSDFHSPTDALAAVLLDPPDLLIADVHASGMSGLDLTATLRSDAAPDLPVILTAVRPTPELTANARELGVRFVLRKPLDEFAELCAAVRRELYLADAADAVRHLDDLRTDFFVDLSHQLRTPVTAMRLAIDGLFAELRDVMNPSQRNLASISRRSIERIVALVENQLDLLQMMSGERSVCRRLVDLDRLLRTLPRRPLGDGADGAEAPVTVLTRGGDGAAGPLYAFTDPDHLAAVVDCVLGAGSLSSRRTIRLDYDAGQESYVLDVRVEFLSAPGDAGAAFGGADPVSALDFEYRAYRALLERIGADLVTEKNDDLKWIRIHLPRYPFYDRRVDFINPVHHVRSESGAGGDAGANNVCVVKCDLADSNGHDYLAADDPAVRDFLERATSVVSNGDAIVRGKQHGAVYLVLVDRSQDELDHVVRFLGGAEGDRRGPYVWKPQTIMPDDREIDRLVCDLELV
jgi:DNA-binding response OmpR family regulator